MSTVIEVVDGIPRIRSTLTSLNIGNFNFASNTMSSTNTNGNINLVPDGTGQVEFDGSAAGTKIGSTDFGGITDT